MAEEVFALSPISARAVQPSEQDYDAIKEAFMETSRGRWFLGEYAKRNRNADTRMVLDAVARIEETISASKKPVRDPLLDEALASLRAALTEARDATAAAVDGLAIEQNLGPVRKGARVIKEIAWRLREIGADGRICDLIDSQVAAIEGAAAKLTPADLASALNGAFDRIEGKIAALDADEAAAPPSAPEATPPPAMDVASAAEAKVEAQAEIRVEEAVEAAAMTQAPHVATEAKAETGIEARLESEPVAAGPAIADEPSTAATSEAASEPADAFDASDEAVLDMVAMEMAAPDTDEAYEPRIEDADVYERQIHAGQALADRAGENPVRAEDETPAPEPQANGMEASRTVSAPVSAPSWEIDVTFASDAVNAAEAPAVATALLQATPLQATPLQAAPEPELHSAPEPEPQPAAAPSLGSSLLANGIVQRPRASGPDPLAPIRRMSQNERIAFFS